MDSQKIRVGPHPCAVATDMGRNNATTGSTIPNQMM